MSIKTPRLNISFPRRKNAPAPAQDDAWRPAQYRWGLRHVRRGPDKQYHFPGQGADEVVRKVVRKHWIFLVRPALPAIGALAFFLLLTVVHAALPRLGPLWTALQLVALLLIVLAIVWFLYKDFLEWWLDIFIITNKRIIDWRGVLHPRRQETPIEKVQQVALDQDTILEILLSYGLVHLYLAGGQVRLEHVPDPKGVKDAIMGITNEIKSKKKKESVPTPADPEVATVLKTLGQTKPVPKLPDADAKYPPRHEDSFLGPRRTFGGPLRIPLEVHYSWGETTVMYLQRSRYVLLARLAIPVILLFLVLPVAFFQPVLWFIAAVAVLVLLVIIGLIYINYVDDVFILTTRRIIDIERKFIFFYEARAEAEYKNIKDIRVQVPSVLHLMLNIGTVYIETPGSSPDIILSNIDHPFFIQDKIYELKGFKEEVDKIKAANERKEELYGWFGKVVSSLETSLEKKVESRGAPNLQNMDFWSAADMASGYGLRVVVIGEAAVNSGQPPGRIIQQSPPPGALIKQGGEIQVLLSKRPTTTILE